jgi:hypothetical protein
LHPEEVLAEGDDLLVPHEILESGLVETTRR